MNQNFTEPVNTYNELPSETTQVEIPKGVHLSNAFSDMKSPVHENLQSSQISQSNLENSNFGMNSSMLNTS